MILRSWLLALALLCFPTVCVAQEPERSVTYYDTLSPYGDWVEVGTYGRVWRPYQQLVGVDFVPYASGGRWVHTPLGWVFEASWEWAWLPFHYGRWYEDDLNGWVWVPGDVWAPAWVEWRFGGGYIGWVPTGPPHRPSPRWYFVESQHFAEPEIWQHRTTAVSERTAFAATRAIPPPSGIAWSQGPAIEQVRATSRVAITERKLEAPRPLPHAVGTFPERLPPAAPRPGAPLAPSKAQPVPARAMPPMPDRQPPPMQEPARPPSVPRQAMPAAPPPVPEQRQRAEQPNPVREPSKPAQEPFRPMIEPTPPPRQPPPIREQRALPTPASPPPPIQRQAPAAQPQGQPPPVAPVKRPTVQPQAPAGPMPGPGRAPDRAPKH